jgi:hypothetical protein
MLDERDGPERVQGGWRLDVWCMGTVAGHAQERKRERVRRGGGVPLGFGKNQRWQRERV